MSRHRPISLLYIATIASLASKHAKLPWTSKGQSAFNTPIDHLCPADDRVVEKGVSGLSLSGTRRLPSITLTSTLVLPSEAR